MFNPFYSIASQNYNLDKENLQFLALHVASASQSLSKQLKYSDQTKLETQILKDITRTVAALKPLIGWLDRVPFRGTSRTSVQVAYEFEILIVSLNRSKAI